MHEERAGTLPLPSLFCRKERRRRRKEAGRQVSLDMPYKFSINAYKGLPPNEPPEESSPPRRRAMERRWRCEVLKLCPMKDSFFPPRGRAFLLNHEKASA